MQDVSDDDEAGTLQVPPLRGGTAVGCRGCSGDVPASQRHGVQKGLGGVLVGAVTCVEDRHVDPAGVGQQVRGTAGGVAHDDGVRPHGHDRLGGVLEGLALGH